MRARAGVECVGEFLGQSAKTETSTRACCKNGKANVKNKRGDIVRGRGSVKEVSALMLVGLGERTEKSRRQTRSGPNIPAAPRRGYMAAI